MGNERSAPVPYRPPVDPVSMLPTSLYNTLVHGEPDEVEFLLREQKAVDLAASERFGQTRMSSLMLITQGNIAFAAEKLQRVLERCSESQVSELCNAQDSRGNNVLDYLSKRPEGEAVRAFQVLMQTNAFNISIPSRTKLMSQAVCANNDMLLVYFINHKILPEELNKEELSRALSMAVTVAGNLQLADLLLELRADVNQPFQNLLIYEFNVERSVVSRITPLLEACSKHNLEAVRYLLDKGADPNLQVQYGYFPIHAACGCPEVELLLVERGADPNSDQYKRNAQKGLYHGQLHAIQKDIEDRYAVGRMVKAAE